MQTYENFVQFWSAHNKKVITELDKRAMAMIWKHESAPHCEK